MNKKTSQERIDRAMQWIPGGVNSPVRAFRAVGGNPVFFCRGNGAKLYDADGDVYTDYVCSWGAMIVGHAHPDVVEAVQRQVETGLGFGAPTEQETDMAQHLCTRVASLEKVRLVNSGTEATMSALRLARGYTRRDYIVKFAGCYHGHGDSFLTKAGSGAATLGISDSAGVPAGLAQLSLTVPYNDLAAVQDLFREKGEEIAAVIVEPIAGNMGMVLPVEEFLPGLRRLCDEYNSLLIFDEVMTGFRVGAGGAQQIYDVRPDLTTLGKVIGGGLPIGAFGGRSDIMDHIAPNGPVYQAGTLSGNPVAVAAGLATLNILAKEDHYEKLSHYSQRLCDGLKTIAEEAGMALQTCHVGGMFGIFPGQTQPVHNFQQASSNCNQELFRHFFHGMLQEGIYLAPSPFEAGFISLAHDEAELDHTLSAARNVLRNIKTGG